LCDFALHLHVHRLVNVIDHLLYACSSAHRGPRSFPTRRSSDLVSGASCRRSGRAASSAHRPRPPSVSRRGPSQSSPTRLAASARSEEHTSELQSRGHLVCRLLLEKKNHKIDSESNCRG